MPARTHPRPPARRLPGAASRRTLVALALGVGALVLLAAAVRGGPAAHALTLTQASRPRTASSKLSGGALAGAIVAAVIALLCLAWALARAFAYEPRWTLSLRHSLAEASFRASATWAELRDWARLGR